MNKSHRWKLREEYFSWEEITYTLIQQVVNGIKELISQIKPGESKDFLLDNEKFFDFRIRINLTRTEAGTKLKMYCPLSKEIQNNQYFIDMANSIIERLKQEQVVVEAELVIPLKET